MLLCKSDVYTHCYTLHLAQTHSRCMNWTFLHIYRQIKITWSRKRQEFQRDGWTCRPPPAPPAPSPQHLNTMCEGFLSLPPPPSPPPFQSGMFFSFQIHTKASWVRVTHSKQEHSRLPAWLDLDVGRSRPTKLNFNFHVLTKLLRLITFLIH